MLTLVEVAKVVAETAALDDSVLEGAADDTATLLALLGGSGPEPPPTRVQSVEYVPSGAVSLERCRVLVTDWIAPWKRLARIVDIFVVESLQFAVTDRNSRLLETRATSDVFVAISALWTRSHQARDSTIFPAIEEVGVPAIAGVITHSEDE